MGAETDRNATLDGGQGPVFVVGPSRSGTSVLRAILNQNSQLWLTHETHYFDDLRVRLGDRARGRLSEDDRALVERYFLKLGHLPYGHEGRPEQSSVDPDELRRDAAALGGSADAYFEAYCRARLRTFDRVRWGEKTPRHVFRIDDLLEVWPDARVICTVRDPRAVAASYRDWKRSKEPKAEEDRKRVVRSYNVVLNAMLWKAAAAASAQALASHGADRVRLFRYEELLARPEESLRSLSAWLGVEYEEAMLDVPSVQSSYDDTEAGISTAPLERWRERLSPTEIRVIQTVCGAMMDRLGYQRERVKAPVHSVAAVWASVPLAFGRAALANRRRIGKAPEYIRRRLRLAASRGRS